MRSGHRWRNASKVQTRRRQVSSDARDRVLTSSDLSTPRERGSYLRVVVIVVVIVCRGVLLRAILVATRRGRRRSIHIRSSRDAHRILRERDFFIADSVRSND